MYCCMYQYRCSTGWSILSREYSHHINLTRLLCCLFCKSDVPYLSNAGNANGSHGYPHDDDRHQEDDVCTFAIPHGSVKVRRRRQLVLHAAHLGHSR